MTEKEKVLELMKKFLSDSKKESEEAKNELEKTVRSKIDNLQKISKIFASRYFEGYDSKYGSIEVTGVDLNEEEIDVEYSDSWGYGGYCNEFKAIDLEVFEDKFEEDYFYKCKEKRIKELISDIENTEKILKEKRELLEETKKEDFDEC